MSSDSQEAKSFFLFVLVVETWWQVFIVHATVWMYCNDILPTAHNADPDRPYSFLEILLRALNYW